MVKSKTAADVVPEFVTDADDPAAPVVVVPASIVAAAPGGPEGTLDNLDPSPSNSVAVMRPGFALSLMTIPLPTRRSVFTYALLFTCKPASGSVVTRPTRLLLVSTNRCEEPTSKLLVISTFPVRT